jgi:hypothetical protein
MKHADRIQFWKRPKDKANWPNSLSDTFAAMPAGKMLVYRHEQPSTAPCGEAGAMKCCNHDCEQGRTCPRRTVDPRPFSALVLVGIAALYVAVLLLAWRVW